MEQDSSTDADELPLPSHHTIHQLSTSERRILYDYVVEVSYVWTILFNYPVKLVSCCVCTQVTSQQALLKLDPDLYRDDMAVLKGRCAFIRKRTNDFSQCVAKLKSQAKSETGTEEEKEEVDTKGKTYLQLLKDKRDYKRRRQKYRAKNVHITRRTPTEVSVTERACWRESIGPVYPVNWDHHHPLLFALVCTVSVLHIQLWFVPISVFCSKENVPNSWYCCWPIHSLYSVAHTMVH